MIPKVIHYVWVGGKPLTPLAEKCIESWKKFCPDYEIKRWDESNFDINQNVFCKEAYDNKKWAFVSDYIRLKVLYDEGGIYMDTDVEVVKNLDKFLEHKGFSGFECTLKIPTGIMAAEKENSWIKLMLDYYRDRHFIKEDGSLENMPNVLFMTDYTCKNYSLKLNNVFQDIGDYVFYPMEYFCPKPDGYGDFLATKETYTIHRFASSWVPDKVKNKKRKKEKLKRIIAFFIGKNLLEKILNKIHKNKEQKSSEDLYKILNDEKINTNSKKERD